MVLQGELLWDANKKPESFPIFLRSAQLNPSNWLPFLYLGRYYNSWAGKRDAEKARKCYLKSFNLNPRSTEAGTALSDILREQVNTWGRGVVVDSRLIGHEFDSHKRKINKLEAKEKQNLWLIV